MAMIRRRHLTVAGQLVNQWQRHPETVLEGSSRSQKRVDGSHGVRTTVVASYVGRSPATPQGTRGRRTRNSSSGMAA